MLQRQDGPRNREGMISRHMKKSDIIEKIYGEIKNTYTQGSIRQRIEALFLDNIGKIITREQILSVAKDPKTGKEPENWHQRLSELRTDDGYTILSWRNRKDLKVQEYLMPHSKKRLKAGKRIRPLIKHGSKFCSVLTLLANGTRVAVFVV